MTLFYLDPGNSSFFANIYGNFFFFLAHVGPEVVLTNGCIIGAKCQITAPEVIPENTVIYGKDCFRRVQADRPPVSNSPHKCIFPLEFG